jgi:hypothetical protein
MLTYDDCLALCGLTAEEVDAIARHEGLPEIVALEKGSCLCTTAEGLEIIRRIIVDELTEAAGRGDARSVARLQLALRHFGDRFERSSIVEAAVGSSAEALLADTAMRALGLDTTTAPWVRERVSAHLSVMLHHYGLEAAQVRRRLPAELSTAAMRCACCAETPRCRRFLAGTGDMEEPSAFCPNAELFREMRRTEGTCDAQPGAPRPART